VLRGKRVHDLCGLRVIVDTDVEAERRASWVASSQVRVSVRVRVRVRVRARARGEGEGEGEGEG
jgi:hypothetical protein